MPPLVPVSDRRRDVAFPGAIDWERAMLLLAAWVLVSHGAVYGREKKFIYFKLMIFSILNEDDFSQCGFLGLCSGGAAWSGIRWGQASGG